jgi:hypothetical protein
METSTFRLELSMLLLAEIKAANVSAEGAKGPGVTYRRDADRSTLNLSIYFVHI